MNRKDIATSFLQEASAGRLQEVFARHVHADFRHHNPWFASDGASLRAAMEENARRNPGKTLKVHHALEDGDVVAIHSHVRHNAEERGYVLVHIFRFEGAKIAELWDIAMEVPADSPNQAGLF